MAVRPSTATTWCREALLREAVIAAAATA
ncbi:hypothetical protein L195_g046406, partial [Trifolium pratense]